MFLRGLGLLGLGQVRAAIGQLKIAERAGFAPAALYLGASLAAIGQNEQAAKVLERAPEIALTTPLVPSLLADCWLRAGQPDRAVPVLREALEGRWVGHAGLQRRLGLALAAKGEHAEAVPILGRGLDTRPTDLGSLLVLLQLYEDTGEGDVEALRSRLRAYRAATSESGPPIADLWLAHLERSGAEPAADSEGGD